MTTLAPDYVVKPPADLDEAALGDLLAPVLAHSAVLVHSAPSGKSAGEALRSKRLAAAARAVLPESCHTPFRPETVSAFAYFAGLRAGIAADAFDHDVVRNELLRPASLLVVVWQASLFDGAMTPETDGFFDEDGLPAWDAWVALVEPDRDEFPVGLVCWVPEWLSEDVDRAIAVDAAESVSWLRRDDSGRLHVHGWGRRWAEGDQ